MRSQSTVELRDLKIATDIGTYGPEDIVPEAHLLDLTLAIDPSLVLIDRDDMALVFDYDPLIREIDHLARDGHYETQERLMTRIIEACAAYREIGSVELFLRKSPVLGQTGSLGVRIFVSEEQIERLRQS